MKKLNKVIKEVNDALEGVTLTGQGHDIALGLIVAKLVKGGSNVV